MEVTELQDTGNSFVEGGGVGCFCKMLVQVCGIFTEMFLKALVVKLLFFWSYLAQQFRMEEVVGFGEAELYGKVRKS